MVRHGLTKISQVKQLISYLEQIDEQLDGFIYNSYEKPKSYYGYYGYYGNYSYNYYASKYLYEDYEYKNENNLIILFLTLMICSCSLAPGMHMHSSSTWLDNEKEVYIDSIDKVIKIKDISSAQVDLELISQPYRIGYGDQLSITVWGLQDVFPISNITPDQNLRRVDSNGEAFFFHM